MLFTSPSFFVLLSITFILYYLPFLKKGQVPILIISSLVFYAYHTPLLLFLFLSSVTVNTYLSYRICLDTAGREKVFATLAIVFNLLLLAFFKYNGLLFGILSEEFVGTSTSLLDFMVKIPLPIGISFYTFEGISLVIDVFRGKKTLPAGHLVDARFTRHFTNTLFFISFFPHLIAGPILKAHDFYPQISVKRIREVQWSYAFQCLTVGYFFKMVVADNLKDQTFWLEYPYFLNISTFTNLLLLFGYSMQIFADFAGYSWIAIGLAALFGYNFPTNFNFPYISQTFAEFWRRWHISLSSWLREYLYIPLGGNRKGKFREYVNLFIVMLLGGLWHGGAWSYAIWGGFHGGALAIERATKKLWSIPDFLPYRIFKMLWVFTFVTCAWLLFKLPNFTHVIAFVKALGVNHRLGISFTTQEASLLLYSLPVIVLHVYELVRNTSILQSISRENTYFERFVRPATMGILLFLIALNSGSQGNFIYFQF